MRKLTILFVLLIIAFVFQYCKSSKKAQAAKANAVNYTTHIQPVVAATCTPCHFPPKGNKKPLDTYEDVRSNIDDILVRIQKNPEEKGFMPFKHPKLPDSTINLFVRFKTEGMTAK